MANPFRLPMAPRTIRNLFSKPSTRRYPYDDPAALRRRARHDQVRRGDVQLLHSVRKALPRRGDHGLAREPHLGHRAPDLHRLQRLRRGLRQEQPEHVHRLQERPHPRRGRPGGPAPRPRGVAQSRSGTGRGGSGQSGDARKLTSPPTASVLGSAGFFMPRRHDALNRLIIEAAQLVRPARGAKPAATAPIAYLRHNQGTRANGTWIT
jgi:hypothetical protein